MSGSGPEREKSDMSRTLQLVTEYPEVRGFTGVPAVTVPGHVLGVRASTLVPNRPWRAGTSCVALPAGNERDASSEPCPPSAFDVLAGTLPRRRRRQHRHLIDVSQPSHHRHQHHR
ncbi:hypothetical protein MTO96_040356 [Rhipicephalus appendiculatus]